ncbi:MAG: PLP-dependent aminotransferase family protein [Actinomycetota bacterium]|nr:PLP-dependent aminotransferase family protein [Actinomycetota bacterium]
MRQETEPLAGHRLLLALQRTGGASLHEQLERSLRTEIRSGRLPAGTRLPASRTLAQQLAISRGVVLEAYSQLAAEGYLIASQGAPTRVASAPSAERAPVPAATLHRPYRISLDPGTPDLAGFPWRNWTRSLRVALAGAPFDALGRGDPRGLPALRDELMSYLSRARAAAPEPEHTLVCSGFSEGFAVLCRTLRDRGVERIAIEDPGWLSHRLIAQRAGLETVPVAVDDQGLVVPELWDSGCEVALTTPAHQFPTGVVLSSQRRAALLEWAEERDGLIVEDDYDSELRLDRDAVGALQGVIPERVAAIGSLSKRLAPGLALGWILSPSWLTGALTYEKGAAGASPPAIEQAALADFLARGALERHLRRARLALRERREALLRLLRGRLPQARVVGIPAGVFTLAILPEEVDEDRVVSRAAGQGVLVEGLRTHRSIARGRPGLVLGYGNSSPDALGHGVEVIADSLV